MREIILAKQGVILTDTCQIPWARVGPSAAVLVAQISRPTDYYSGPRQRDRVACCACALQFHFYTRKHTILKTIQMFRHCKATDPRDQVYGLPGLQNHLSSGRRIEADYGETTAGVYTDVAVMAQVLKMDSTFYLAFNTGTPFGRWPTIRHGCLTGPA